MTHAQEIGRDCCDWILQSSVKSSPIQRLKNCFWWTNDSTSVTTRATVVSPLAHVLHEIMVFKIADSFSIHMFDSVRCKKYSRFSPTFFRLSFSFQSFSCFRLTCQDSHRKARERRTCLFACLPPLFGFLSVPPFFFLTFSSFFPVTLFLCHGYSQLFFAH